MMLLRAGRCYEISEEHVRNSGRLRNKRQKCYQRLLPWLMQLKYNAGRAITVSSPGISDLIVLVNLNYGPRKRTYNGIRQ